MLLLQLSLSSLWRLNIFFFVNRKRNQLFKNYVYPILEKKKIKSYLVNLSHLSSKLMSSTYNENVIMFKTSNVGSQLKNKSSNWIKGLLLGLGLQPGFMLTLWSIIKNRMRPDLSCFRPISAERCFKGILCNSTNTPVCENVVGRLLCSHKLFRSWQKIDPRKTIIIIIVN